MTNHREQFLALAREAHARLLDCQRDKLPFCCALLRRERAHWLNMARRSFAN